METEDGGKWSEGAKLWAREREAFLKPALEEPPEPEQTSSDAPGMLLILGGFLVVLLVRRKWYNLIQRQTFIR